MSIAVPALTVRQWLPSWDDADFSSESFRSRPPEHFYLLSLPAGTLRALVGIYRREAKSGRARVRDLGIQRTHDMERSSEISEYVKYGFPWSSLPPRKRTSPAYRDLVKPGWLPTAVVVNILTPDAERDGRQVAPNDLITVEDRKPGCVEVRLPEASGPDWVPASVPPLEVIDGQHRLWAFDDAPSDYELPVVAFYGLDRSWQAYLFYTINIKPKRINTSLAFDLYPLLRTEDWLERFEGHSIYRESRAQELTEALWSHPKSPWRDRINMLGERGGKSVTQASWIRSLLATLVKAWEGRRVQVGGLFGAPVGSDRLVLPWNRAQQAAFLIYAWREFRDAVLGTEAAWAKDLRAAENSHSAPFDGLATMINSDVGVRGFLYVLNDLCYLRADKLELFDWQVATSADATSEIAVTEALKDFRDLKAAKYVESLCKRLALYDWRSSRASGLSDEERRAKARFRGGTGYRELREDLLRHVAAGENGTSETAAEAVEILGY